MSDPGGGIPACTEADTPPPREQNDKQVQKYYLGHNFVAAGKNARYVEVWENNLLLSFSIDKGRLVALRAKKP